jgi:hypothetical protein
VSLLPQHLKEFLSPFRILCNRHALSPVYRSLELSPSKVVGAASYGILEVNLKLGLTDTIYIDAVTFLAVIDSLPQEEEFVLLHDQGVLNWTCGSAKGKLALVAIEDMPKISRVPRRPAWAPPALLGPALERGALSCGSNTLASVGLHGIVLDNRLGLTILSSDNTTLAACKLPGGPIPNAPDIMTIAPDAAALLAQVLGAEGRLECDETSLFYYDGGCKLLLKQVAPLKHDLAAVLKNFSESKIVAPIPEDRISFFLKRAAALSESRKHSYVTLHAMAGQLALSFTENAAASEEYYLVDGLDVGEGLRIVLDAAKLARALAHVSDVTLDYVGRGCVIFRGKEPDFMYMIGGKP